MLIPKVAIVGPSGAVGKTLVQLLHERSFPFSEIRLCGSERSIGKKICVVDKSIKVEKATPELYKQVEIVFIAAGSEVSRSLTPIAVDSGAIVIDKSSEFRMNKDVPLVIPEVNGNDLNCHKGIISSPNCSTTPLAMTLKALSCISPITRVVVDTYQSVSGSGLPAMEELRTQTNDVLSNGNVTPKVYPHQIAFNALPHIDDFHESGYTTEELKMVYETRKILHQPELSISATCVRIPVMVGHSEAVHIEFKSSVEVEHVRAVLSKSPGISVVDDPKTRSYPLPIQVEGKDDIYVGRIRRDKSNARGLAMWLVSDNLRKGDSLNALQIAEELLKKGMILNKKGENNYA